MTRDDPKITPLAATTGINSNEKLIIDAVDEIDVSLGNKDRARYFLSESKKRQGLDGVSKDLFATFQDLQELFPGFILSAQIESSQFFISFCSPAMKKYKLPFDSQPIVTDVTYKADPNGHYLRSSVIYVPVLKRSVVFFQTVFKRADSLQFKEYFLALFKTFNLIHHHQLFGTLMDFSAAQLSGFVKACMEHLQCTTTTDAMGLVKGCYMHWMQSVIRVANNRTLVPAEKLVLFKRQYTT